MKNERDSYLQSLISVHELARCRNISETNPKPKSYSYTYQMTSNSGTKSVCKKAFDAIHGVTDGQIRLYNPLPMGKITN